MARKKITFTTVGGSSILTIFAVLCFIIFALLSLSTAKANRTLTDKSVAAVTNYYQADTKAEEILAELRAGEKPEGVKKKGNVYSYTCPVDDSQQLSVEVKIKSGKYHILKWQKEYIGEWKADTSIEVWGGAEITE